MEIELCAGITVGKKTARKLNLPVMGKVCNDKMPMRIKGDDGKWRCLRCNKIYVELMYATRIRRVP